MRSDNYLERELYRMKCRNCGLPREAHIATLTAAGKTLRLCPDGSGTSYPATVDMKIELHYRGGEALPWIAKWINPAGENGEVAATLPADALRLAGEAIDKALEEKSLDDLTLEKAIHEA
jgi:hypothetical protein